MALSHRARPQRRLFVLMMSANVSVVSLDVLGKDGVFTVPKIEAWIEQALQIVTVHSALEVKVLTQGLHPGVGEASVSLVIAAGFPAPDLVYPADLNPDARRTSAAGRAFRDWQILAGNNNLGLLEAIAKVVWENLDHDSPIFTRSEVANHMVKMHKLIFKYGPSVFCCKPQAGLRRGGWNPPEEADAAPCSR